MMKPIVDEFLNGRSGLLAALGPSGSGKTHTVFGSAKEPGLVPRALRHIFEAATSSRSFYLSVFEISLEKGKGEKLYDLSPDGGDIHMQQSVVKGLKEVLIKDVAQAEAILAGAKLKRATAMTNSNSQSSRSQCIINIRCAIDEAEGMSKSSFSGTGLTFVDLAGAEREKKTGNQGGRLLESNFINNTSMVFGLCLRSLLEHQKNPKKPLQKHFQSSLLTRYLRDYLEGRKRMALILTARSGPEDYFDASFLLRQASPYMEIKFSNVEETSKLPGNKRRNQTACSDKQKRVKLCNADEKDEAEKTTRVSSNFNGEDVSNEVKGDSMLKGSEAEPAGLSNPNAKLQRDYHVMQGFAKALWNVLKEYKERVKAMQNEIDLLTEKISTGHESYLAMEKELRDLKSHCSCTQQLHISYVSSIGGTNSVPRVSVLEEVINYEQVASAKVQEHAALECAEEPALYSAREQYPLYPDHKHDGMIAPEEKHNVSPFECKTANLSPEKDDCYRFVDETFEASISEGDNIETRLPSHEKSERRYELSAHQTIQNGSGEIQDRGPTVVHFRDSPVTKSFEFADDKTKLDAILTTTPFQGAALQSSGFESSVQQNTQAQCSPLKCENSHNRVCREDFHEKDPTEKNDKITDAAAHFPKSHVMDLKVQRENNGNSTDVKKDKENGTNSPQSNFNSKLETKEISHNPSKAERPKRRLMPASSLLLRDVGSLDVTDDNVKHRVGRGGQRLGEDESKRSRGNATLLRLLKNHLPR
ncbi:hypothetical protein RND81_02G066900 [Saponaria officinalis]